MWKFTNLSSQGATDKLDLSVHSGVFAGNTDKFEDSLVRATSAGLTIVFLHACICRKLRGHGTHNSISSGDTIPNFSNSGHVPLKSVSCTRNFPLKNLPLILISKKFHIWEVSPNKISILREKIGHFCIIHNIKNVVKCDDIQPC